MSEPIPEHDTPILEMTSRPRVPQPVEYGDPTSNNFWVEYPNGLIDLSRSTHLKDLKASAEKQLNIDSESPGAQDVLQTDSTIAPTLLPGQLDVSVDGDRTIRVDTERTAVVIVDMQNFFLSKELRSHPKGLACVDPLMNVVPFLRGKGVKILWVNWGLTKAELSTIPPSLVRGFMKHNSGEAPSGGFGSELPGDFGALLMRGEKNSDLYGPLQGLYEEGRDKATDLWIHKNRMSGLWDQSLLENHLKESGIKTLFFAGVNADQCVLGTLADAYYKGYDCVLLKDATATTSPEGGYENVLYNASRSYGFATSTEQVLNSTGLQTE